MINYKIIIVITFEDGENGNERATDLLRFFCLLVFEQETRSKEKIVFKKEGNTTVTYNSYFYNVRYSRLHPMVFFRDDNLSVSLRVT